MLKRRKLSPIARGLSALNLAALCLLLSGEAFAQQDESTPPTDAAESEDSEARDADAEPSATVETEATTETLTPAPAESQPSETESENALLKAEVAELRAAVTELQTKQEEAEMGGLLDEEDVQLETDAFKIYGFMDMGVQRTWVNEKALVAALLDTGATTFAVGNIDLYFDFNPDPDWRGLAEIRFTGAPHGQIDNYGGIAGDFERRSTQQYDPHGTAVNAPMWGGSIVIERAWVEWKRFPALQIRTGSFFTPFGIWNVDHGSPTLISISMPQFIQQTYFPLRQVGVQALGSVFAGEYEIAYRAWLSNGRQELSNLDFNDDKAFGARAFVRREEAKVKTQLGASFHHGRVADKVVNITSAPPLTDDILFENKETWAYRESIIGADLSLDIHKTRIRVEGTAQLRDFEEGKHLPVGFTAPSKTYPSSWRFGVYALIAQELPWWGLEPYMYAELIQQDWVLPDGLVLLGPGLNIRFSPAAQLKLQSTSSLFVDIADTYQGDIKLNNVTSALARIVLAF